MNNNQIVEKWLNERAEIYRNKLDEKRITASGNSKEKTTVIMTNEGGRIEVPFYNKAFVHGRTPNSNQNPEYLKKWVGWAGSTILAKWCKDKGVNINPYAVAWKVAREGWKAQDNGTIVKETITKESIADLNKQIGKLYLTELKSNIQEAWLQ